MELYDVWRVAWRRWWLIAIPALVAVIYVLATYQAPAGTWTSVLRFTAAQTPAEDAAPGAMAPYEDSSYVPWLASEYLVNALTHWVKTGSFAQAVSDRLAADGVEIDASALAGAFAADNQRSVMEVHINWGDPDQLAQIAGVVTQVLQDDSSDYFPQTAANPVTVQPLDGVGIGAVPQSVMSRVKAFFPVAIGLAAGVALAFLVEYLDPTLRTREELEAMGLEVVAEVPRPK